MPIDWAKISPIATGQTHRSRNTRSRMGRKRVAPRQVICSESTLLSSFHPTKTDMIMPPSGSMTLLVAVSKKLNRVRPKSVKSLRQPNERAHRVPNRAAIPVLSTTALRRFIFSSSMKKVIAISLMEMVEVSDARKRRKKKSVDHTVPPASEWNIDGSTSNTSVGPADGDMPKVKTAGNMITPAKIATTVSSDAVIRADRPKRVLSAK